MIESRLKSHEETIASIRNDIRRVKNTHFRGNTTIAKNDNAAEVAQLTTEKERATAEFNKALSDLKIQEAKAGVVTNIGRESHHLILKEKALPSAEPESPWAMYIVISSCVVTLIVVLIVIAINRPAQTPYDDIFLRVNYANRRINKKSTPVAEGGRL
jgi:hypothetical protein